MAKVEDTIRESRKYAKRLGGLGFTVSSKGRKIVVKFGRKLNIVECPTKEAAEVLVSQFNATLKWQIEQIEEFISLMQKNCEQLSFTSQLYPEPKEQIGTPSDMANALISETLEEALSK